MNTHELDDYRMVSDRDATFPWAKFERILRVSEIFQPQWEDGLPTEPNLIVGPREPVANQFIWLLMTGPKALGFIAAIMRGKNWAEIHGGFRRGVPGRIKRAAAVWTLSTLFSALHLRKVTGFIPEFNMPARIMARETGLRFEGRISSACWRHGKPYAMLAYGVTSDEFLNWLRVVGQKRANNPAEQPEQRPVNGIEHPGEPAQRHGGH